MTSQAAERPPTHIKVPIYLKAKEAAEYLGVTTVFLLREIREHRGPVVSRFGRGKRHTYRILYDDLMEWARSNRKGRL